MSMNTLRWQFSLKALRKCNPLKGGARDAFFVQLVLAQADGAPKAEDCRSLEQYLEKVGIECWKFEHHTGLKSMVREAKRVWSQLEAEFKHPGKAVDAMEKILKASTGQLSYLQHATRYHLKGRLPMLVAMIQEAEARKAKRFKGFCTAMDNAFVLRAGGRREGWLKRRAGR